MGPLVRQSRRNRISFGFCIMIQFYCLQKYEIIYCLPEHSRMIRAISAIRNLLLLKKK
jgi:hypothetical protein